MLFTERLDNVDESVELLPDSAKLKPEKPVHENEAANVRRYAYAPQSYQDAISSPDSSKLKDAMNEEFNALWENETFEFTSLPEGRTAYLNAPIDCGLYMEQPKPRL